MQLHLSENVFNNTDTYGIRSLGELRISLSYEVVSQHNSVNYLSYFIIELSKITSKSIFVEYNLMAL